MQERLQDRLNRRRELGTLRPLPSSPPKSSPSSAFIDFSSNDYLGLSHCPDQLRLVERSYTQTLSSSNQNSQWNGLGATGSRLLSGNSVYVQQLEETLARHHRRPAALICNSGYDANLALISSLAATVDALFVYDELCHNSLVMGMRMQNNTTAVSFRHNQIQDLKAKLQQTNHPTVVVVVESVYSMDGDMAPLPEILAVAQDYRATVVVDEAHGLGIYGSTNPYDLSPPETNRQKGAAGMGVLAAYGLEEHPALLASVHTYGKAAGCHGAVICGSRTLKEFLWNYGRPLVYSTALPLHSLVTIRCAYQTMLQCDDRRQHLFSLRRFFCQHLQTALAQTDMDLLPSPSPIQALKIPGNERCAHFCQLLFRNSRERIRLYPIRSPTVPKGQERVRIVLHAHNTVAQVRELVRLILETWNDMETSTTTRASLSTTSTRKISRL